MKRTLPRISPAFPVLLLLLVVQLSWIARDTRPWPVWDCYDSAVHVMRALGRDPAHPVQTASGFLRTLSEAGRPPLYQLCTIPFVAVLGFSEDAFLAVNLLMMAVLFLAVYRAVRDLCGRLAGLTAAVAAVTFPPVVHILHQYRSYNGAFAAIALTLWALMTLIARRRARDAWAASAAATAALMMHPVAAYVLLAPMASTWIWLFLQPGDRNRSLPQRSTAAKVAFLLRRPLFLRGLLPAAAVPPLVVWWWYRSFGAYVVRYFHELRSPWISAYRGATRLSHTFKHIPPDWRWLARTSPFHLGWILVLCLVLAAAVLLRRGDGISRAVVGWLAAAYVGVGVFPRLASWQYGAFALPLAAVVLGLGAGWIRPRWGRRAAATLILAAAVINLVVVTAGAPGVPERLQSVLGVVRGRSSLCLEADPALAAHYPLADALSLILSNGAAGGGRDTVFVAAAEELAPAARFWLLRFHPGRISVTGMSTPVFGNAFPFRSLLGSRWLVEVEGYHTVNPYLRALERTLRSPPPEITASYQSVQMFLWPRGLRLRIYQRRRPVTVEEIDAWLASLSLPPRYTTQAALVAAAVLEREGRVAEAIQRLQEAGRIAVQQPLLRAEILAQTARLFLQGGERAEAARFAHRALSVVRWNPTARKVLRRLRNRPAPR